MDLAIISSGSQVLNLKEYIHKFKVKKISELVFVKNNLWQAYGT